MNRKNAYANILGFLAGLTNSLSIITIGVFTTHVTGAATNAGVNLGNLNLPSVALYIGVLTFFIIGGFFGASLMSRRGLAPSILLAGALLIIAGIFAPAKILQRSTDQFVFSFLAATAMGAQNASTTSTPLGRTTHITGASTDLGVALSRMDGKNSVRLGLFVLSFIVGTIVAFFLQIMVGTRGFLLAGASLVLVSVFLMKYGLEEAAKVSKVQH